MFITCKQQKNCFWVPLKYSRSRTCTNSLGDCYITKTLERMRYTVGATLGTNRWIQYGATWAVPTRSPSADLRMHTWSAGKMADGIRYMLILSDMDWEFYIDVLSIWDGFWDNCYIQEWDLGAMIENSTKMLPWCLVTISILKHFCSFL